MTENICEKCGNNLPYNNKRFCSKECFHSSPKPWVIKKNKSKFMREVTIKKNQPIVCKYFPMSPTDGVHKALKHICGYYFKKFKNPYYKKNNKNKEE